MPSADWLFESAAASFQARHLALVLSGLLADGSGTLGVVKKAGGAVLVQHPRDCQFPDMPLAAVATGFADAVVPISAMPRAIAECLARRDVALDWASWAAPFDAPERAAS